MTHTNRPLSPADRDRALARLRRLTTSFTLGGLAAVAGLGFVVHDLNVGHAAAASSASSTSSSASTTTAAPTTAASATATPSSSTTIVSGGS
ncbi:MAG: hypothetical protein JOZ46_04305 [Candidatus Dormibacteraeota bacterium]|nr:hypothetical protein [Candidatus Dormibacteraeota bacterium]MBV9525022.1 hypothetical protein [Candidatus Dormibacteraeota bacterium]